MASKGRRTAASFFRRVALRRATLVPPPAASASRFPPPPVRAAQPNALDLGRAQAAVLGVGAAGDAAAEPAVARRGPAVRAELPARRWGRLDPGADSRFLTWGTTTAAAAHLGDSGVFCVFLPSGRRSNLAPMARPAASAGLCEPFRPTVVPFIYFEAPVVLTEQVRSFLN